MKSGPLWLKRTVCYIYFILQLNIFNLTHFLQYTVFGNSVKAQTLNYNFYTMKTMDLSLYIYYHENHSKPPLEAVPWLGSGNRSLKYLNRTRQTNTDNVCCIQVFVTVDLAVRQGMMRHLNRGCSTAHILYQSTKENKDKTN